MDLELPMGLAAAFLEGTVTLIWERLFDGYDHGLYPKSLVATFDPRARLLGRPLRQVRSARRVLRLEGALSFPSKGSKENRVTF